ncbi:MAG: HAD family phosphatase [Acidobacteriota bacterium]|nr:HAD family phosphatase [Acidobacteriota bacterium]
MVDAVIFDMDGLMFDTEPVWTRAWTPTLASIGLEFDADLADACRGTSGTSMEAAISRFLPDVDAVRVRETLFSTAHSMMSEGVPKKPGLDELLAYLRGCDVPLAVASSSSPELIDLHLTNGGVRAFFSYLVSGVGMSHPKPEPDIFLKAAAEIGVDPSRTLVLEDSLSGVRAGVAGGFVTVMVPDLVAPDDYARANATRVCESLAEVRDLLERGELG